MMSPDHIEHPYPSEDEKLTIMADTGIELKQLTNWFVNNRKRYWKPKVEELRKKSERSHLTLQEAAAKAQAASGHQNIIALARANSAAAMVSSEGEESTGGGGGGMGQTTKKKVVMTSKKRKKYSTLDEEEEVSPSLSKRSRANNNRRASKSKAKVSSSSTSSTHVVNPIISIMGIHTAKTHESVKASRKHRRNRITISEPEYNSSEIESDDSESNDNCIKSKIRGVMGQGKVVLVSNPLVAAGSTDITYQEVVSSVPPPSTTIQEVANQVADLDYSIGSSDDDLVENILGSGIIATAAAVANTDSVDDAATSADVAAVAVCEGIMPHNCNLADALGSKVCLFLLLDI